MYFSGAKCVSLF